MELNIFFIFRNPFGFNPYGGGYPQQYPSVYSPQGYSNQYGAPGGYYTGGVAYPNASPYATGYPSAPYGGQVAQGYGYPTAPSNYGYQQPYYAPQYPAGPQAQPFNYPFPAPQQPQYNNANNLPNGYYGQPRSRQPSHQRSRARRQPSSSSSSSSLDQLQQNSPFAAPSSSGDNF